MRLQHLGNVQAPWTLLTVSIAGQNDDAAYRAATNAIAQLADPRLTAILDPTNEEQVLVLTSAQSDADIHALVGAVAGALYGVHPDVRISATSLKAQEAAKRHEKMIVVKMSALVGAGVLALGGLGYYFWKRRK